MQKFRRADKKRKTEAEVDTLVGLMMSVKKKPRVGTNNKKRKVLHTREPSHYEDEDEEWDENVVETLEERKKQKNNKNNKEGEEQGKEVEGEEKGEKVEEEEKDEEKKNVLKRSGGCKTSSRPMVPSHCDGGYGAEGKYLPWKF